MDLPLPGDFSHSVVKQLFPEAYDPPTHRRLKIDWKQQHFPPQQSVLPQAQLARPCLSVSFIFLFGKQGIRLFCLVIFKNTSANTSNEIYKCNGCKSGKQPTSDARFFGKRYLFWHKGDCSVDWVCVTDAQGGFMKACGRVSSCCRGRVCLWQFLFKAFSFINPF